MDEEREEMERKLGRRLRGEGRWRERLKNWRVMMMTTNEEGLSPCQFNENEMMTKKEVKLHDTKREG